VADELGWTLADFHRCMVDAGAGGLREGDAPLEETEHDAWASEETPTETVTVSEEADPLRYVQMRQRLAALSRALHALDDREKCVMEMVYERSLPMQEVGDVLGVTVSRVSQIHKGAVEKLRKRLRNW
jgi:RNA polymerase sigma factor for flagellar operon FliA